MAYRYIISNRAQNDLDNIIEYMAFELQEIKAAKSFIDEYNKAIDDLLAFPESGTLAYSDNEYITDLTVRKKLISKHVIFYKFEDDAIKVIAILHQKANTNNTKFSI